MYGIITVKSIGTHALQTLYREGNGTVIGVTSHGLYILVKERILFISYRQYRSPITITFTKPIVPPLDIERGEAIQIENGHLEIIGHDFLFTTAGIKPWYPAPVKQAIGSHTEQFQRLFHLANAAVSKKGDIGLCILLPHLLSLPEKKELNPQLSSIMNTVTNLQVALHGEDRHRITASLRNLLGLGRGLTPAGDDFIIGLLLTFNRWKHHLLPCFDLRALNQVSITLANQHTTTLSANLIECAVKGEADERLINAVDHIFTANPPFGICIDELTDMGSSSGVDTLVGMAAALTYRHK